MIFSNKLSNTTNPSTGSFSKLKSLALDIIAVFSSQFYYMISFAANHLRCYECLGSRENCSEEKISTNSDKQIVCGSVEDRCILVYSRDENLKQFKMNCSHRDHTCREEVESCNEAMKTKKLQCCDVTCCDSDFCNKPIYSGLPFEITVISLFTLTKS